MTNDYIHPIFESVLKREAKEILLKQRGLAIWMTGLSGAGKSTLGVALEKLLYEQGYLTKLLDGDNIRSGINSNLGFSECDRHENIRRVAEVAKLFVNCGIITINCFISPRTEMRTLAKQIIGSENFLEVFISAPLAVCELRDTKGLYKKARLGQIKSFTGIDDPYESPIAADIVVKTDIQTIEQSVNTIYNAVIPRIVL